jgi:hypothetical protein
MRYWYGNWFGNWFGNWWPKAPAFRAPLIFYVKNGGNDFASGRDDANAWATLAKVKASAGLFYIGDKIRLKCGSVWYEDMIVPFPYLTFEPYGDGPLPIIAGDISALGTSGDWVNLGGNDWARDAGGIIPYVATFDGTVKGIRTATRPWTTPYQWDYQDGYFGVYSEGNPTSFYSSIHAGARNYCFYSNLPVSVSDIMSRGANIAGFLFYTGSAGSMADGIEAFNIGDHGYRAGIMINGASRMTVQDAKAYQCYDGLVVSGYDEQVSDSNLILRVKAYRNDSSGVSIQGCTTDPDGGRACKSNIIEWCETYENNQRIDDRAGIYIIEAGIGNIVRYCKSRNNGTATTRSQGIMIDTDSEAVEAHHNLCHHNNNGGIGMCALYHNVYNNTLYHNNEGSWDSGELNFFNDWHEGGVNAAYNTVRNNIAVASIGKLVFKVSAGSEIGHVVDYNSYYADIVAPFDWIGTTKTYAQWKAATGYEAHSWNINPLLTALYYSRNFALKCSGYGNTYIGCYPVLGEVTIGDEVGNRLFNDTIAMKRDFIDVVPKRIFEDKPNVY